MSEDISVSTGRIRRCAGLIRLPQEFQNALHDALESKRLSGTHVQRLTESGTRLLKVRSLRHLVQLYAKHPRSMIVNS
jgi:hypothetical protein